MMTTSAAPAAERMARSICSAVVTGSIVTPCGASTLVGPATTVTVAPRSRAASANANPIRPLERFVNMRTGSSASSVRPAPINTRSPFMLWRTRSSSSVASTIAPTSASRPGPASPEASGPESGPTKRNPRARSVRTVLCVAAFRHISTSIAGATSTGARVARTSAVSASGAPPCTKRDIRSAVAGAITIASAASARSMCSI